MGTVTRSRNERIIAAINSVGHQVAKVGFIDKKNYPDGTPIAYVASIQEYGCPQKSIPPRPFFRVAIANNRTKWKEIFSKSAKQAFNGKITFAQALGRVGLSAQNDTQKVITLITSPPLSELTLLIRKWKDEHPGQPVTGTIVGKMAREVGKGVNLSGISTKPLNDTGALLAHLTYAVTGKNDATG